MKKLLVIIALGLFLITPLKADDIRDFQIEGMSIGDSLLDYVSKDEIEKRKKYYPKSKKWFMFAMKVSSFKTYDAFQVHVKEDDSRYIIGTLDGLIKHNGPIKDLTKIKKLIGLKNLKNKIHFKKYSSLESQISSISDDIAYNNHDIQDGIKAKLINLNDLIEINFFKEILNSHTKKIRSKNYDILIYQIIRDSINLMVKDLIKNTINN